MASPSTKPYFLRALHQWCTDQGFTPYLIVSVDASTRVPMPYVRDGQITLNLSYEATHGLQIENDWISFKARFGGVSQDILIPVQNVLAIFANENGEGMVFDGTEMPPEPPENPPETEGTKKSERPTLTRVK